MRWIVGSSAIVLALCVLWGSAGANDPAQRHLELKQLMLELINDARREAGAPSVRLGANGAAQLHAEQMVAGCFHSHWGLDGLKPYMRYSLRGGYQANAENVAESNAWRVGTDRCAIHKSAARPDLERLVREAMAGWLRSPGHRVNLLNPAHRLVNLGIAWRGSAKYLFRAVQHFEGDYVRLDRPPAIVGGMLTLSGRTVNGASLGAGLTVQHDPPPQPQQRGTLNETGPYCGGYPVAAVFPHARWTQRSTTPTCTEPGSVEPRGDGGWVELPTIAAEEWASSGAAFTIRVDLSAVLRQFGSGVYTISLGGDVQGEQATLMEYAVFYGLYPLNRMFVYAGATTTASALSEGLGLRAVFIWDGAAWQAYAASGARLIPGSADLEIAAGDWLWLAS